MKYRIENGKATMPISEVNRLNDCFEELNKEREEFEEEKCLFKDSLVYSDGYGFQYRLMSTPKVKRQISDMNENLSKLREEREKLLSIKEFMKWRRENK